MAHHFCAQQIVPREYGKYFFGLIPFFAMGIHVFHWCLGIENAMDFYPSRFLFIGRARQTLRLQRQYPFPIYSGYESFINMGERLRSLPEVPQGTSLGGP